MNSVDRLFSNNFMNVMINTKRLATIFVLTAILITGSLNAVQYAYSSGPDKLTVKYFGPIATSPAETFIEIYKKIDEFESLPLGPPILIENIGDEFMVISQNYGKDKLNSNTVFRIIERTTGSDDFEIDVVEIHTSCSKPLFIGQTVLGVVNAIVTLEVVDGTLGDDSILPDNAEGDCTDNKKPKHTATITLKKAITNDNGGLIITADQIQENFLPKIDDLDVIFGEPTTISTKEPHTISEAQVDDYSFVLIAGDTDCPSMLDEEFTVKKNKDITCTIYNDDNGDGTSGGEGVAFGFNGIEFENVADTSRSIAGTETCAIKKAVPCIEQQGVGPSLIWVIVDDELLDPNSTIILWSLNPAGAFPQVNNCALAGSFPATTTEVAGTNGFGLLCTTFKPGNWNINYAFILT